MEDTKAASEWLYGPRPGLGSGVVISVDTNYAGAVAKAEAAAAELAEGLFGAREEFMPVAGAVVDAEVVITLPCVFISDSRYKVYRAVR
jgi:hypothetical protein